jgi:hypothetical protein
MHLLLALPGLATPSAERANVPRLPALARLVATAGSPTREPEGLGAALAPHYAVARQIDFPLAPLRLAALGGNPGDGYWLAADPVTLIAGREDVRPAGMVTDLAPEDADRIIATLNRHFAADGLAFVAPQPDAWFVHAPSPPQMLTHALDAARGRALRALLPEGPDAGPWRRWLSEIQMLLHDHPVNVEREQAGRASVNSVWFSGGGTLPPRGASGTRLRTWANGGIATAFALHAGAPARALPANLAGALQMAADVSDHVVVLDAPLDLAQIESAWAAPAWDALARGRLESVTLIADGNGEALTWTVRRPNLRRRIGERFARHDLGALLGAARLTS